MEVVDLERAQDCSLSLFLRASLWVPVTEIIPSEPVSGHSYVFFFRFVAATMLMTAKVKEDCVVLCFISTKD